MRRVKLVVITLFILVAFLFIISLVLPSKVTVSRSIMISATPSTVSEEFIEFKNWKNWFPPLRNKNLKVTTSSLKDSLFEIFSKDNQKIAVIKLLSANKDSAAFLIKTGVNEIETYRFTEVPNGEAKTLLSWDITSNLGKNPWKKFIGILLDKINGPGYENVLSSLKTAAEKDSVFHAE